MSKWEKLLALVREGKIPATWLDQPKEEIVSEILFIRPNRTEQLVWFEVVTEDGSPPDIQIHEIGRECRGRNAPRTEQTWYNVKLKPGTAIVEYFAEFDRVVASATICR